MKIVIPRERRPFERRVAATPDTVKKLVKTGASVLVESGAGEASSITDDAYRDAGAVLEPLAEKLFREADLILKVQRPTTSAEEGLDELGLMKPGAVLVGMLAPLQFPEATDLYAKNNITSFALELLPRITRAQSMDVLSSQSNLAGYKAVIDAADRFDRAFPMMMTAAGTIPPARVLVLGAGVAGLQAIATAKRLGAVVSAFDVRAAVKEQVESLGATFVEVPMENGESGETTAGYAREMGEAYKKRQANLIQQTLITQDIAICTALIPGRKAPLLITEEMVKGMKPGSVIVDLAVEMGGNCPLSVPGEVVTKYGVKITGYHNVPSRLAADASALYARNVLSFVSLFFGSEDGEFSIDYNDELIKGTMLTREEKIVHPSLTGEGA